MSPFVDEDVFSPLGDQLYRLASAYYDADPDAQSVDREVIAHRISRELPNPKVAEALQIALEELPVVDSEVNVVTEYIAMRAQQAGAKLSSILAAGKVPGKALDEYLRFHEALVLGPTQAEVFQNASVAQIVEEKANPENLIKLYPVRLNERCDGGAMGGHHILIFGRPESGKTMFSINMMAGFLAQGKRVLYLGNEDPLPTILLRTVGRLARMNKFEVLDDPNKAESVARSHGYENLVMAKLAPGTFREISEYIKEYDPNVVVIDQLRNIKIKAENRTTSLEAAASAARNIAAKHDVLVVSITQAGDSADRKLALEMGDVDGSNTGIPAQVDLMIGIGVNPDLEAAGQRMISLCKNKLGAWHGYFPVSVDITTCNVRS